MGNELPISTSWHQEELKAQKGTNLGYESVLVDPACPGGAKSAIRKYRKSFCFLRTKSAGLVLLSWCSTVRLRDEVADAKLEQLWVCEEQNVLFFPITSYPPECFARELYIKFSVRSLPNLGHEERFSVVICRYSLRFGHKYPSRCFPECWNVISQIQGQAIFCIVKNISFLRSHYANSNSLKKSLLALS